MESAPRACLARSHRVGCRACPGGLAVAALSSDHAPARSRLGLRGARATVSPMVHEVIDLSESQSQQSQLPEWADDDMDGGLDEMQFGGGGVSCPATQEDGVPDAASGEMGDAVGSEASDDFFAGARYRSAGAMDEEEAEAAAEAEPSFDGVNVLCKDGCETQQLASLGAGETQVFGDDDEELSPPRALVLVATSLLAPAGSTNNRVDFELGGGEEVTTIGRKD